MTLYIVRRVLWFVPVLLAVSLITFALMHMVPGGPWDEEGRTLAPSVIENLNRRYGLDLPYWQQYLKFSEVGSTIYFDEGNGAPVLRSSSSDPD